METNMQSTLYEFPKLKIASELFLYVSFFLRAQYNHFLAFDVQVAPAMIPV